MKIVIGMDESTCSKQAFESVLSRQWPEQTSFQLISVIEPVKSIEADSDISEETWSAHYRQMRSLRRSQAEKLLQDAGKLLLEQNHEWQVQTTISESYTADEVIIEHAKDWQADLIILGSHSRRGINKILLGSVSNSVLLKAHCSVEIIKAQMPKSEQEFNLLIAVDGSAHSDAAIKAVLDRPWSNSTRFRIVTVIKSAIDSCLGIEGSIAVLNVLDQETRRIEEAKAQLSAKAAGLICKYGKERVEIKVLCGEPRECILKMIEDWPCHLLIAGSQGRTALGRLFLGSVSQALSLHAKSSVEIVKLQMRKISKKAEDLATAMSL